MASLGARMTGAMKGDVATFEEIERDPAAMGQAITVIVVAGVAALIGNIFRLGISYGIMAMIISLVGYAIWAVLVTLIGTKVMPEPATKADFAETFRTIGFAASPGVFNVLAIIPFLGPFLSFLISIWSLVIMVIAVRTVLDYSNTGRAIIVVVIGFIVYWIVTFLVLTPLFIGAAFMQ
ncbi:MAG TPA: YIP1 family protein [Vicinamibacterales bacterium]|nr:YIP1 family protein [Vicinamibacterales bacterium]